jgi:hypothetical protein
MPDRVFARSARNSTPCRSTSYVISNTKFVAERDGFEPEISLAVLPSTQSETPVPGKRPKTTESQEPRPYGVPYEGGVDLVLRPGRDNLIRAHANDFNRRSCDPGILQGAHERSDALEAFSRWGVVVSTTP